MSQPIMEKYQISPNFVLFLVLANQLGLTILHFQNNLAFLYQDSWIAVVGTGAIFFLLIWMIYQTFRHGPDDIAQLHSQMFGKGIGRLLNGCLFLYFFLAGTTVLMGYIDILITWIFPFVKNWQLAVIFMMAIIYVIAGGFRVIAGLCLFSVIVPSILIAMLFLQAGLSQYTNLLPVMEHSYHEFLLGIQSMTVGFSGIESLLVYFPFIKNHKASHKWAQLGNLFSILLYLIASVAAILYFSEGQLKKTIWPTLSIWKDISFTFLERFEYIATTCWVFSILTNTSLSIWAACRMGSKAIGVQPSKVLIGSSLVIVGIIYWMSSTELIKSFHNFYGFVSLFFLYGYLPLLFLTSLFLARKDKKDEK